MAKPERGDSDVIKGRAGVYLRVLERLGDFAHKRGLAMLLVLLFFSVFCFGLYEGAAWIATEVFKPIVAKTVEVLDSTIKENQSQSESLRVSKDTLTSLTEIQRDLLYFQKETRDVGIETREVALKQAASIDAIQKTNTQIPPLLEKVAAEAKLLRQVVEDKPSDPMRPGSGASINKGKPDSSGGGTGGR